MSKKIFIHPQARPKLQSGHYTLEVTQTVKKENALLETFTKKQDLLVQGPQFKLPPDLVYSVHPPSNTSLDKRTRTLAHIAFTQETFPWQRSIGAGKDAPWVALLILHESEAEDFEVKEIPLEKVGEQYLSFTKRIKDLPNKKETDTCTILDIKESRFRTIIPNQEDLALFTHIRKIEAHEQEAETSISVVVANRLGQVGRNFAFLVSLEGMAEHIPSKESNASDISSTASIGVLALYAWSFTVEQAETGFIAVAQRLSDSSNLVTQATGNEAADAALQQGFVPLPHHLRNGENTFSWYRGPLTDYKVERETGFVHRKPEQLERFDEETGLFDESYAAAWQLGQLLAMKDEAFAKALYQWKSEHRRKVRLQGIKSQNLAKLQQMLPEPLFDATIDFTQVEEEDIAAMIKQGLAPILNQLFSEPE